MPARPQVVPAPNAPDPTPAVHVVRRGRPRSDRVHRAILDATRELLVENGFSRLRLEHVATRAGVGKATIYRRWRTREALVLELLMELAAPHIEIEDVGDTHAELVAATTHAMRALTDTPFGPVIRTLLSQIAGNPALGDPFRAAVVQGRRDAIAQVVARGIARGDLRPDAEADVATELLVGPVYFRLMFGGELTPEFVERVVDAVTRGFSSGRGAQAGRRALRMSPGLDGADPRPTR